jgi:hypothetical protein
LRRRRKTQARIKSARRTKTPSKDPMTMPAIAPPENPFRFRLAVEAVGDADFVAVEDVADEVEVKRGCIDEVATMGSTTLSQRFVVFEKTQQESVAFGELAAQ